MIRTAGLAISLLALSACVEPESGPACLHEVVVLGAGQDAGAPQIGNAGDEGPRLLPTAIALVDREQGTRFLFEATPAITEQLAALDALAPPGDGLGIDGIFLTHAHIGHYLGLAYLGREAANADGVPVHVMPRMGEFLRFSGPWSQLVELGNIDLKPLTQGEAVQIGPVTDVTPLRVPHRDEYSETVGFLIRHDARRLLFLPDIDSWEAWKQSEDVDIAKMLGQVDYALVDASFYDDDELPGRDMSEIPHPRVSDTMDLLADLDPQVRGRVTFIHYNHSNPIRDPASEQSALVDEKGFGIARRGDSFCLD